MKILLIDGDSAFTSDIRALVEKGSKPDEPGGDIELSVVPSIVQEFEKECDTNDAIVLEQMDGNAEYGILNLITGKGCRAPIVMVVKSHDPADELRARKSGVYDYLVLGQLNSELLYNSIRYAIERKKREDSLRSSEALYKTLTERSPVGIWNISKDGYTIYVNSAMCDLLEIGGAEEIRNTSYRTFFTEESQRRIDAENKKRAEGIVSSYEATIIGAKGTRREVVISGGPLFDRNGAFYGMIGTFTDISKRKEAELQLWAAKDNAERATMLKDKFVSLVAHDLRAPLSSVLSYLKMSRKEIEGKKILRAETFIDSSIKMSEDLLQLINSLLSLERIKTGVLVPKRRYFNFRMLALKVFMGISSPAEKKGVSTVIDVPQESRIYADEELLREIIQNLASNAIKFCRSGDRVTIYFRGNGISIIKVADTGVGIESGRLDSIFSYDLKTSTVGTAGELGTGLGLPLCKDLIKAQGGEIRLESSHGSGSEFEIVLPYRKPEAIIIHPDENVSGLIGKALHRLGIESKSVRSCDEAIKLGNEGNADMAVADYATVRRSGFTFIDAFRTSSRNHNPPLFAVIEGGKEIKDELDAWITEFVHLPVDEYEFERKVRRHIG